MAFFNKQKKCIQSKAGKASRGISKARCSVYKGNAGKNRGTATDNDFTSHVNKGTPLKTDYGRRLMKAIHDHCMTPVAAQQVNNNAANRRGTPIDMILKDADGNPIIIEVKTTGVEEVTFLSEYANKTDPVYKTHYSFHHQHNIPNTPWNRYFYQLVNGMNLYGRAHRLKTNTIIRGVLILVCRYTVYWHPHSFKYIPNIGINTPKRKKNVSKAASIQLVPDIASPQTTTTTVADPSAEWIESTNRQFNRHKRNLLRNIK